MLLTQMGVGWKAKAPFGLRPTCVELYQTRQREKGSALVSRCGSTRAWKSNPRNRNKNFISGLFVVRGWLSTLVRPTRPETQPRHLITPPGEGAFWPSAYTTPSNQRGVWL